MNKAMIIGNLGNDPELRYTQNQTPVATFSVASTERWKDSDGNKQEHTEWHRIVVWKGLAEVCNEHLSKGSKVFIEGKLRTRKWEDQDGNIRYSTEIIARDLEMLGGRQEETASRPNEENVEPPMPDDVPF
ncbi:MAG: single-stranded DNA-binding protein [Thermodesulfobacteriota bacterium]|nr:single-stranded DNA-binding protein [Thermodesulfobacteriota bacterium]